MAITKEQLSKLTAVLNSFEEPGEWPDDIDGRCGGNYDDAFSMGVSFGEELLAEKIRKVLAICCED